MANRNRIPTVFSIYMLDVICCALGCVILLWQLQHYEAEQQAEANRLQIEANRLQTEATRKPDAAAKLTTGRRRETQRHAGQHPHDDRVSSRDAADASAC